MDSGQKTAREPESQRERERGRERERDCFAALAMTNENNNYADKNRTKKHYVKITNIVRF